MQLQRGEAGGAFMGGFIHVFIQKSTLTLYHNPLKVHMHDRADQNLPCAYKPNPLNKRHGEFAHNMQLRQSCVHTGVVIQADWLSQQTLHQGRAYMHLLIPLTRQYHYTAPQHAQTELANLLNMLPISRSTAQCHLSSSELVLAASSELDVPTFPVCVSMKVAWLF